MEFKEQYGFSHKIFGSKSALNFADADTKGGENSPGYPTVNIEGAPSAGERKYNWEKKLILQISEAELPGVTAFFLRLIPSVKGQHHGQAKDKWFEFVYQNDKHNFFLKVGQGKTVYAVPCSRGEGAYIASIFVRRLSKRMGVAPSGLIPILKELIK